MNLYETLRQGFLRLIQENHLERDPIRVKAKVLTPQEAIGNPEDHDYPILKGKERMMEAEFQGARGHAFTDMYGDFRGELREVAHMDLANNYRRAIFISTLNAVMRFLGKADKTIHCRDDSPPICALKLVSHIRERFGSPRIAFAGFQPRMVAALSEGFEIRVTDLDPDNIGQKRAGVLIEPPHQMSEILSWSDLLVATGSAVVNGTLPDCLVHKPTVFYGVSIAGASELLGLHRFCPLGM